MNLDVISNATLDFTPSRLIDPIEMIGTMRNEVTTINLATTNIEAEGQFGLQGIIDKLSDRTSTSAGTLNVSFTPAALHITSAQQNQCAAKNWTVVI